MLDSGNLTALETEVITLMSEMLYDQSGPTTAFLEAKKNWSVVLNEEVRVTREVLVIHNTIACDHRWECYFLHTELPLGMVQAGYVTMTGPLTQLSRCICNFRIQVTANSPRFLQTYWD
ncbi:unnamed protein product [Sphenostylis stenocarpa]|uniref:Uncharacterized protein n=1 Tax=Sphenostylis stenocarpa TaxID=92480 RepID=A0AA86W229_9FABA|nr:unnamed protein product [Sphenostylis stenocarpa]